jgi:hypothetical protein
LTQNRIVRKMLQIFEKIIAFSFIMVDNFASF